MISPRPLHHKKNLGAVYTSAELVDALYAFAQHHQAHPFGKIADLSCGDGAFLKPLVAPLITRAHQAKKNPKTILQDSLYAFDIAPEAALQCKAVLDQEAKAYGVEGVAWNIHVQDTATQAFLEHYTDHFDWIVGNPPYVRLQNLENHRRTFLRSLPSSAKGASDLYLACTEIALRCVKSGGHVLFIMPSSWLRTMAGAGLRQVLAHGGHLQALLDFKNQQVFANASTYVAAILLKKEAGLEHFSYQDASQTPWGAAYDVSMAELPTSLPNLTKPSLRRPNITPTLGQIARISTGIATLADGYLTGKLRGQSHGIALWETKAGEVQVEAQALRTLIKASTLKYDHEDQSLRALFPYQTDSKGKLQLRTEIEIARDWPRAYSYLRRIQPILQARDKGVPKGYAWYAYGRSQGLEGLFGPKLLTSGMNLAPKFLQHHHPDALFLSGYCILPQAGISLDRLQQVLNTPQMKDFVQSRGKPYQNGWWSYAKNIIQHYPLPEELFKDL